MPYVSPLAFSLRRARRIVHRIARSFFANVASDHGYIHYAGIVGMLVMAVGMGTVTLGRHAVAPPIAKPAATVDSARPVLAYPFDTTVVWGPHQFNALNSVAQFYVEAFSITPTPGRRYLFRLVNGAPNGTGKVSNARVFVNGWRIIPQNEFTSSVVERTEIVALRTNDTIDVRVMGPTGRYVTATILSVPDPTYVIYGPKQYTITSGSGYLLHDTTFTRPTGAAPPYFLYMVEGTDAGVDLPDGELTTLNGTEYEPAFLANRWFTGALTEVPLNSSNTLRQELVGDLNSYTNVWVTATDTTKPTLTISAPTPSQVTNQTSITVSGTLSDQTGVGVTVNGVTATVTSNTSYSASVSLGSEGSNVLTVVATDAAGKHTDSTRTVIRDTQAPSLSVSAPADGSATKNATVTVTATASDATGVTVNTNGTPLSSGGGGSFSGSVALAYGSNVLTTTAVDGAGNTTNVVRTVTRDTVLPALAVQAPLDQLVTVADSVTVSGTVTDLTTVTVTVGGVATSVSAGAFSRKVALAAGLNTIAIVATDAATNQVTINRHVTREVDIPPDPSTVASSIDPTTVTNVAASTAFIYTGPDSIQTGVTPGAIQEQRAAVVRGKVMDRNGAAIPGTEITILDHPELGQTKSRADGQFDLVVNGGGSLTLNYAHGGFLTAQRTLEVPWNDYLTSPEVVLVSLDSVSTVVDFSDPIEVARGTVVGQGDSARQATMLFEQGTTAHLILPNGDTITPSSLNVRATEFTVGTTGPAAMPGTLPRTSAYTYAAELSADEAISAGAVDVQFDKPVAFYLNNFLGLPVGTIVPVGAYDRVAGRWVPERNGRVIEILSFSGDTANVDVSGGGLPASQAALDTLGITVAERRKLATLYTVGQTLWRSEHMHFSAHDWNFGWTLPEKASPPLVDIHVGNKTPRCEGKRPGSIIKCESQRLGEVLDVIGTPFTLHYGSDRVIGNAIDRTITMARQRRVDTAQITGGMPRNTFPSHVKRIIYQLDVAGQSFRVLPVLDSVVNANVFYWDGRDAYGRILSGKQPARLSVGFEYEPIYGALTFDGAVSFGDAAGQLNVGIAGTDAQQLIELSWLWEGELGAWDSRGQGLGAWTLNAHHVYDPTGRVLYRGDGERVAASIMGNTISRFAGTGFTTYNGDSLSTLATNLNSMFRIAAASDGSVYVADNGNKRIRRILPSGMVVTVAGDGTTGSGGDGGPATAAQFVTPKGIAVAPDGSIYVADQNAHRVRRIGPDGIITTVAGTGTSGYSGDGGPGSAAMLSSPVDVAVAPDGAVYICDYGNSVIRRLGLDGVIRTYAGTSVQGYGGDDGPARDALLYHPTGIAVGPDGTLYISDQTNNRIRKVGPDGQMRHVAGRPFNGFAGDGGRASASNVEVYLPEGLAVGPDGSLYIADAGNRRIRRIGPDGMINTVVGTGVIPCVGFGCTGEGNNGPAPQAALYAATGVAVGPDGALYIADNFFVRKVGPALPGLSPSDMLIASEDGAELYQFDVSGRHKLTRHALTGDTLLVFGYNGSGYLTSVADAAGNVTTIERNMQGKPTAIEGPFGQRTTVTLDLAGYLASVTNPNGERTQLYYSTGLLDSVADPRGKMHRFDYDDYGRLVEDGDPTGATQVLARTTEDTTYAVSLTSELGRTRRYRVDQLPNGATRRLVTEPSGLSMTQTLYPDGRSVTVDPDSTISSVATQGEGRFGLQAPTLKSLTVQLPSGLTSTMTAARHDSLTDIVNPLSLVTQLDSAQINGEVYTSLYESATRRFTTTTPEGRQMITRIDSVGRVISERLVGVDSTRYQYDAAGRLSQVQSGGRIWTYGYDASGRLHSVLDPLGRRDSLFYDLADRVTRYVLPGGRVLQFAYDSAGNLTSLTPPGQPAHTFRATGLDQDSVYTPPSLGAGSWATEYRYNLDRQLTEIRRPDSVTIAFAYDTAGRPDTVTFDRGQLRFGYSATTGQLTSLAAPDSSTLGFTYDGALPKAVSWSGAIAGSVGVRYDTDFRVVRQAVNGTDSLSFGYDGDGLLTTAGALGLKRHAQTGFLERDSLESVLGTWSYDPKGALAGYAASRGGTSLFETSYVRDSLSRITQLTEIVQGDTTVLAFTYDTAGRLFEVRRDGVLTATYEYDVNGNRTELTTPNGTVTGSYDDQDRLTSYGTATYGYTRAGALRWKAVGSDTTRYTYDALGNLTAVTLPNGTALAYLVDGQNRRIGKKVNGVVVQGFLYQGQLAPVAELDSTGAVVSRFVYASRANVPDYVVKGDSTYRLVLDHLGSVRLVVHATSGSVAQRLDYDEFGRVTQNTSPGFQPFGYAGGLLDGQTGLVRFGARDYDAGTGRWTAKDPLAFAGGSSNLFIYVGGDPINYIDPSGSICSTVNGFVDCVETVIKWWNRIDLGTDLYDLGNALKKAFNPILHPVDAFRRMQDDFNPNDVDRLFSDLENGSDPDGNNQQRRRKLYAGEARKLAEVGASANQMFFPGAFCPLR